MNTSPLGPTQLADWPTPPIQNRTPEPNVAATKRAKRALPAPAIERGSKASGMANQPAIFATSDMRITGGNDKAKNVDVTLTVSTVVARKLLPVKKGGTLF